MSHPIILLHGAIGASDQLNKVAEALQEKNCQTFSFNFSGHGKASFAKEFGIRAFAEELKQFILRNSIVKPHVFGYSMGGYAALYLASKQKDLLGNIATLGTKFSWTPEIAAKEMKMLDPESIAEKVPKFAEALKNRHGDQWWELLSRTAQMMKELGNDNALKAENFAAIENKVLIGIGDKDNMVTLDETVSVCRQIKNGSMFMLPDTKHPIENVSAELLAEILFAFY